MTAQCRSCGSILQLTLVDLGSLPVANDLQPTAAEARALPRHPLHVRVCSGCRLAQADDAVTPDELFSQYAYFSSFSDTWLEHARDFTAGAIPRFGLGPDSLVVEVASNDGYLLRWFVDAGIPVLGVEPAANVAAAAAEVGVPTTVRFFGAETARALVAEGVRADLLVANNVLAHVPDPNDFVAGMATLLVPDGTATVEFPHLLRLIEEVQFDTIYHEHFSYFSLLAAEALFDRHGLRVVDVDELPTHGGSLRLHVRHPRDDDQVGPGVLRVRADEAAAGLAHDDAYRAFGRAVAACTQELRAFLTGCAEAGEAVAAYGAAAKGTTLLNAAGIEADLLPMVADRSPHKVGRFLPGSGIPIVSPEDLAASRPDHVLVLPWNLVDEITCQLRPMLPSTTDFVTAVPHLRRFP